MNIKLQRWIDVTLWCVRYNSLLGCERAIGNNPLPRQMNIPRKSNRKTCALNCVMTHTFYKLHALGHTAEVVPSLEAGRSKPLSLPARMNQNWCWRVFTLRDLLSMLNFYFQHRKRLMHSFRWICLNPSDISHYMPCWEVLASLVWIYFVSDHD